jgi:hypothetical protein
MGFGALPSERARAAGLGSIRAPVGSFASNWAARLCSASEYLSHGEIPRPSLRKTYWLSVVLGRSLGSSLSFALLLMASKS